MTPPEGSDGLPSDLPDIVPETAADVQDYLDTHAPPYRAGIQQGEVIGQVRFEAMRAGYGNGRVELVFENGKHVTVDPATELHGVWQP